MLSVSLALLCWLFLLFEFDFVLSLLGLLVGVSGSGWSFWLELLGLGGGVSDWSGALEFLGLG